MDTSIIICLFLSAWSCTTTAYQVNEDDALPQRTLLRPGDLLRSLDELTLDAQVIYSPIQPAPSPAVTADRRAFNEETPNDHSESDAEYDYDKAYEEFVNKYFAQGEHDLEPEDEEEKSLDDDHATAFESPDEEGESDDSGTKKKRKSSSKICERVQIDDQNCVVCEDPSSNEKSKSCSYSSEPKPRNYAYSKEKSTKRSSDDEDDDDESDGSAEAGRSLKREASPSNDRIQPRRTSVKASSNEKASKCTRRREDGMICFYCGTPSSYTRECIADKNSPKKSAVDESTKKDSKSKKIFKRMVTYSYKSDGKPRIEEKTYAALKGY